MKLGVVFGYWGATPRQGFVELAQDAERLGYDSVWVAESWGNDAFTFGAWVAAHTETIKIGTGVVQIAARTPTATAMAAVTLDHLSNGRLILGLGVSGPQVVEGWYGQPSNKPLARTREYIEVIRRALRREGPLEFDGEFYPLPYRGPGSVGLGKPLKIMTHPLRAEIPIYLGAEGPKNVTQTAEIADGWLPLYYSPYRPRCTPISSPARRRASRSRRCVTVTVTDDVSAALAGVRSRARLLHRRDGRQGAELPHQVDGADGLRGRGVPHAGPLLRGQARRSDRRGARGVRRRDLARRSAGAHPRAAGGVAGEPGHDAAGRRRATPSS